MSASIGFEINGFSLSLAQTEADLRAAQRLRYEVFVTELGGQGDGVDHDRRLECDRFDPIADHVLLRDLGKGRLAGVYRVLRDDQAQGGFYSASEYDLAPLLSSGRRLLELGRSCVHAEYRGGPAMWHLWAGLARYIDVYKSEILFGVASLPGADVARHAPQLSLLHHRHRAPEGLRPRARDAQLMDLIAPENLDRRAAMIGLPSLIKAYLRLGGQVGEGAFVDHAFDCVDVMMIMDTARLKDGPALRLTEAMT